MFDPASRYAKLPVLTWTAPDGAPVVYVARRFLPRAATLPLLAETAVRSDDRPDTLTARTLGDPTVFWRVADANDVMDPGELVDEAGRLVRIPVPQP
jgi:hypothetical protein